ncbi:hypothetical protein CDL15_Pgr025752 [Punica granatum]|uniref:Uncharacterized protein n=1 Tax=Punica granatum TaxID=22663 RepID=A0A218WBI4_PUNGR|nr:hypothetical protein CDL15_Pgr025752 [Punica granatum]
MISSASCWSSNFPPTFSWGESLIILLEEDPGPGRWDGLRPFIEVIRLAYGLQFGHGLCFPGGSGRVTRLAVRSAEEARFICLRYTSNSRIVADFCRVLGPWREIQVWWGGLAVAVAVAMRAVAWLVAVMLELQ